MSVKERAGCSVILAFYAILVAMPSSGFRTPPYAAPNDCKAWECCCLALGKLRVRPAVGIRQTSGLRAEVGRGCRVGSRRLTMPQSEDIDGGGRIAEDREDGQMHDSSSWPRSYIGGDSNAGGQSNPEPQPQGSVGTNEWTVELCSKRLSLLHRKLRQVKNLLAKHARDPGSLDDAQLVKIGRKSNLQVEIAELEAMRRNLWKGAQDTDEREGATSSAQSPPKRSRLPPGPFAGGMLTDNDAAGDQAGRDARGSVSGGNIQEPVWGEAARDVDEERYTADGLRLASPRRRGTTVPPTPPAASLEPAQEDGGDRAAHLPDDAFVASAFGVPGKEGEDFGREQDFGVVEGQVTGMAPLPEEVTPSGGYPKRLAGIMSFCRVSDKETCEILVAMGRVTVNGVVAQDPGMKVDILTDIIVANGIAVTLPPKIDNADETRRPRSDEGKRTGPIPKSEKNTWKAKTKYRWNLDDGLLASRTRRAASLKRRGGRGTGREDGSW
ncbi:unnamed protein product [Ascophyllum nodosum]